MKTVLLCILALVAVFIDECYYSDAVPIAEAAQTMGDDVNRCGCGGGCDSFMEVAACARCCSQLVRKRGMFFASADGSSNGIHNAAACDRNSDSNDIGYNLEYGYKNKSAPTCPDGTVYDVELEKCTERKWRKKHHKRQTSIVGTPCQENIDCQTTGGGAYCDSTKRCECLPAYVNINSYCWQKSNPGQSCTYLEQCTSVTPNAYCGPSGTCVCSNNQPAMLTIDGAFCLNAGECPTNGEFSKLRDPVTGTDIMCHDPRPGTMSCRDDDSVSNSPMAVYNCLCPNPIQTNDPSAACDHADVRTSYCCPVRGIACIQPRDEGNFAGGVQSSRWWYNSATGTCEALAYRGSGGNANNFQTKPLCESYCMTTCRRGQPLQSTDANTGTTLARCSATAPCARTDHECTSDRTTFSICCPTATLICGSTGGVLVDATLVGGPPTVPDLGEATYNGRTWQRYYFDSASQQCVTFNYRGFGGTYNNFQSEAECRTFCSATLCTIGEPLRDSGGATMLCGGAGTAVCPSRYECSGSGYCCPSVNFVCTQPQAVGACSNFAERWWFNPTTRSCERFFYSGCQGNFNNFETYQKCTDTCTTSTAKPLCPQGDAAREAGGVNYIICSGATTNVANCPADYYCYYDGTRYGCCPTRSNSSFTYVCSLLSTCTTQEAKTCSVDGLDPGTACVTPVSRWYYNSQTRLCEIFTYNGCDGNSNNFATKIDCQDYCGVGGCPDGGEPFRDSFNGQYRVCGTTGTDCPSGHNCNVVSLGTVQRFNYCCPIRAFICTMNQDQGQSCGTSTLNRYFFNAASRTCEMFTYNGCGGNRNNFASIEQCYTYCNSAGCPAGTVALQVTGGRTVTQCDANGPNSCPTGYSCSLSTVLQQGVCCGSNAPAGSCPAGQIAYMDSFTSTPLQCQPNVDNSCPNGIFCQYSYALLNSFCCSAGTAQCPTGGIPYTETVGGPPRQCTPGLANSCPSGYNCQATTVVVGTVTSATGYCCGQGTNVCGAGYAPYYVNNQAVPCIPNQVPGSCVAPFACRTNVLSQQSYCCVVSTQLTPVCATGKEAYIVQGAPTLCTLTSPSTGCPDAYSCDLYQTTGSYYCCRFSGVVPGSGAGCPSPFVLLQPVQTCSPGQVNTCPANYFCSFDAANTRYVCCGSGTVAQNPCAPNNGNAYINPTTQQAQTCILGAAQTGCPLNYRCAYSATLRNYYCCSAGPAPVSGQCPAPLVAAITAAGQAQTCVIGVATCPSGYSCTRTATGAALCCGRAGGIIPGIADTYGCASGSAYLYPGTRTPLACTRTGPACPSGYSCRQSTRANSWLCCSNVGGIRGSMPANVGYPTVLQTSGTQSQTNRRSCTSNWDCRDRNGNVRLCINRRCLM